MRYISNLGEKWIFAGHFNVTFCLNFTIIFFKKFHFFKCRFFLPELVESTQDHDCQWEKDHHAWVGPLMGFSRPKTVKIWLKLANFDAF